MCYGLQYLGDEYKGHDECSSYKKPTREKTTVLVGVIIQRVH